LLLRVTGSFSVLALFILSAGCAHTPAKPSARVLHYPRDCSDLAHIARIPNLEELRARGIGDQSTLDQIAKCTSVKSLTLEVDSGLSLAPLAHMQKLTSLHLWNSNITDDMLAGLASAPSLKTISVSGSIGFDADITDNGLKTLSKIRSLESVTLAGGKYTDQGLGYLCELKNLKRLIIPNNAGFTNDGIKQLDRLYGLDELWLQNRRFTRKAEENKGAEHIR
jgi:hypothetical protein